MVNVLLQLEAVYDIYLYTTPITWISSYFLFTTILNLLWTDSRRILE